VTSRAQPDTRADSVSIGVAIITGAGRLEQLKTLLPQLAAFDQVVVVQTQHDDEIRKFCRTLKKPYEFHFHQFRSTATDGQGMHGLNDWGFSHARNLSFKYLKTTHALWIDTDDVIGRTLHGREILATPDIAYRAFRKVAEEAPDTDVWFMDYVYAHDEFGQPNVTQVRERFLRLDAGWHWVYPIHEILIPTRKPKHALVTDIQILHRPQADAAESGARNLHMLEDWRTQLEHYHDQHDMARCRLLLATTIWGQERYAEAVSLFEEFLTNHRNAVSLERWTAMCFATKCLLFLGDLPKARKMALDAIAEQPGLADGYLLLAKIKYANEEEPRDILELIVQGGRVEQAPPEVIRNPLDYTYEPYCVASDCNYMLHQYEAALEYALKAVRIRPGDAQAEALRAKAASALKAKEATTAAAALYKFLVDYDEHEKANRIFEFLPYVAQKDMQVQDLAVATRNRTKHLQDDKAYVALYTSDDPNWQAVPEEWFEKGFIAGRDVYEYIVGRLARHRDIKRILHVGCLDGFHSLLLAKSGYEVVGIDLNNAAVDIANERAASLGVSARFLHSWFERLDPHTKVDPFTTDEPETFFQHFDAVICTDQLEKAQDPEFIIGNLVDCAKDGAPIILTTPHEAYDQGDIPFNRDETVPPKIVRAFTQEMFEYLLLSNREYRVHECHYLPFANAYREKQGWLVGELYRAPRPNGPRIRIFCGEPMNALNPESFARHGLGGSETAVIQMARSWARLGCLAVVYGNDVGIYDGVLYRDHNEFSLDLKSEIFIAWRLPNLFQHGRPNADTTVLWMHDLFSTTEIPDSSWEHIDRVAVLSKFHAEYFQKIHTNTPADKVWITRNGIDNTRFPAELVDKKTPYQYFYSSSADRGLEELVEIWPKIKADIPEATLHVCYGLDNPIKGAKQMGRYELYDRMIALRKQLKDMPGVIHHERINQTELARIQCASEAWLYPYQPGEIWQGSGGFLETYCITALEAQAAKAWPICRMNGALPEVVHKHTDWTADLTVENLVEILTNLHENRPFFEQFIQEQREWAMRQTWARLAEDWLKQLAPKEEVLV
jgi:2-polyprenyl-3-methyl-5-hydroxy-6-metoxy-1,4-benzoquinol methylase